MTHPTAEQVLAAFNNGEPVDLTALEFCVITGGPMETAGSGRMAGQTVKLSEERFWPFERGEVLVISKNTDREPFGECRKPGKWDVREYSTGDFACAVALSALARSTPEPGLYEWTGGVWRRCEDQGRAEWADNRAWVGVQL